MLGRRRAPDYSGDPADIRRAAIDLLSRREHCAAEIRAKLIARFGKEAPIEPELERLLADGLLSDARFAETFVRAHRNKGHGPLRILRELEQRGVASGVGRGRGGRAFARLARSGARLEGTPFRHGAAGLGRRVATRGAPAAAARLQYRPGAIRPVGPRS